MSCLWKPLWSYIFITVIVADARDLNFEGFSRGKKNEWKQERRKERKKNNPIYPEKLLSKVISTGEKKKNFFWLPQIISSSDVFRYLPLILRKIMVRRQVINNNDDVPQTFWIRFERRMDDFGMLLFRNKSLLSKIWFGRFRVAASTNKKKKKVFLLFGLQK